MVIVVIMIITVIMVILVIMVIVVIMVIMFSVGVPSVVALCVMSSPL